MEWGQARGTCGAAALISPQDVQALAAVEVEDLRDEHRDREGGLQLLALR